MQTGIKHGTSVIPGSATAELLVSDTSLSFWGGVDPVSGLVIDKHHPLAGESVAQKLLALPGSRGSCSGSGVILELLQNNRAPAGLIFCEAEEIITLGVIVSEVMFSSGIPVIRLSPTDFDNLVSGETAELCNDTLDTGVPSAGKQHSSAEDPTQADHIVSGLVLSDTDQQMLDGVNGKAAQVAMEIVTRMASLQGASRLLDVSQGHIDACVYNGPSSLSFAERLVEWGASVRVPTTSNSLSIDKQRWQTQGVDVDFADQAGRLGDAYTAMGAKPTFTCAPYLLDSRPSEGEQIAWAESNAVVYANSVLGARTQKYPDFLDAAIAITARAPETGAHLDDGRAPVLSVDVAYPENADDAWWPLLGHCIGGMVGNRIPLIDGLQTSTPGPDDLKAFCAAFATTSPLPLFHMVGVTPEAAKFTGLMDTQEHPPEPLRVRNEDLMLSWEQLNSASTTTVDLISLGNPHFSKDECRVLAALCTGRQKHHDVQMMITMGREVYREAANSGYIKQLEDFGATFITDTCWCMITEPVIQSSAKVIMTNSAKYAHYGPGLVNREMAFGSLEQCVDTACSAQHTRQHPVWL